MERFQTHIRGQQGERVLHELADDKNVTRDSIQTAGCPSTCQPFTGKCCLVCWSTGKRLMKSSFVSKQNGQTNEWSGGRGQERRGYVSSTLGKAIGAVTSMTGVEPLVIGTKGRSHCYRLEGWLELGPLGRVICLGDWISVRLCSLRSVSVGFVEVSRYLGNSAWRVECGAIGPRQSPVREKGSMFTHTQVVVSS